MVAEPCYAGTGSINSVLAKVKGVQTLSFPLAKPQKLLATSYAIVAVAILAVMMLAQPAWGWRLGAAVFLGIWGFWRLHLWQRDFPYELMVREGWVALRHPLTHKGEMRWRKAIVGSWFIVVRSSRSVWLIPAESVGKTHWHDLRLSLHPNV